MNLIRKGAVVAALVGGITVAGMGMASADAGNYGAYGSPGLLSGNSVQIPITIPINVCGNSVNVLGLLNPTSGSVCVNSVDNYSHNKSWETNNKDSYNKTWNKWQSHHRDCKHHWGHDGDNGDES